MTNEEASERQNVFAILGTRTVHEDDCGMPCLSVRAHDCPSKLNFAVGKAYVFAPLDVDPLPESGRRFFSPCQRDDLTSMVALEVNPRFNFRRDG